MLIFQIAVVIFNYIVLFGIFLSLFFLIVNAKKSIGLILPSSLLIIQGVGFMIGWGESDRRAHATGLESFYFFMLLGMPIVIYLCIIIWNMKRMKVS